MRNVLIALMLLLSVQHVSFAMDSHPCLFLKEGDERALLRNVMKDSVWTRMHSDILLECDTICALDPIEREIIGPRMHAVSCEVLRRVLFLSYSYRMTGDDKYALRAEREMLHACGFVDWNPPHFLDVAEMAAALAIGYDWLYDWLSESSRATILDNIIRKGLDPAEYESTAGRFSLTSNWGQVCNGGITLAAIATLNENREQSSRLIERGRELVFLPMRAEYPPEGCFPEGFGYWAFGTQYNILMLDALQTCYGRDSIEQYLKVPGFLQSGNYCQQLITPSLRTFGYSDNSTRIYLEPAVIWFNTINPDPRTLWQQKRLFYHFRESRSYTKTIKNRLIPFMVIWGAGTGDGPAVKIEEADPPTDKFYFGRGGNDICVMRSGWTADDAYLGFKCGNVRQPHGHMDIGSFYFEDGGTRWSLDLGSDDYGSIQTHVIGLFDMKQQSDRWLKLTKYNNFAHSTTWPEGQYQDIDAVCRISASEESMSATSELSTLYGGALAGLERTVSLDGHAAVIKDRVVAAGSRTRMVWNMTTEACAFRRTGNTITLNDRAGKELKMRVDCNRRFKVELVPATPLNTFEGQNEGISFFRIRYSVPAGRKADLTVTMKMK